MALYELRTYTLRVGTMEEAVKLYQEIGFPALQKGSHLDLFLHQQGLDTSTPSGRAMFQMMGVFAEFERAMIRERVLAGLARAKEQGINLGRRRLEDCDAAKFTAIKRALAAKRGVRRIARDLKTGVGTVLRIKNELAA
jgi:DNA invertase Pin-like site-specific DNA recombinase